MSKTIDEKVVSMQFDNKNFEANVQTSLSTLDKLKRALGFKDASKGLENISAAANKVNMSGMSSAIDSIHMKFSALEVMGVTVLANITNSAVNAGRRMLSALTTKPLKDGFQEYETQINSVQTIMANTGKDVKTVNAALDELNEYADLTIYKFGDMTKNAGMFTAAGVDLDKTMIALKGIGNWAAYAGAGTNEMSRATYQLGQALSAGSIRLQDWMSIEHTAGMAGEKYRQAFIDTAKSHGIAVDNIIKKNGSFRESLKDNWLTTDIFIETMGKFANDQAMTDAATKVKTFTQLIDTLQEALGTGWASSWRIIVGDFEEAKELFTDISNVLGGIINKSADARNKVLQGWKDQGGRKDLVDSLRNVFDGLTSIVKPINEAFRDIFPPITSKQLVGFTKSIKDLTEKMKISDETASKLKRTFKGLFSIFDIIRKGFSILASGISGLFKGGAFSGIGDLILTLIANIGDFFTTINEGFDSGGFAGAFNSSMKAMSSSIKIVTTGLEGCVEVIGKLVRGAGKIAGGVLTSIGKGLGVITDNLSAGDIFAGLAGGGIFLSAKKFISLIDLIKDKFNGISKKKSKSIGETLIEGLGLDVIKTNISDFFSQIGKALGSFTKAINVTSLVSIAAAVAILTKSMKDISELKTEDIAISLGTIGIALLMLKRTFSGMSKILSSFNGKNKGFISAGISLIMIAESVKIFAKAMTEISKLSIEKIAKSLIGLGGGLYILVKAMKSLSSIKANIKTAASMIILAKACKILGDAIKKFSKLSWEGIAHGLTAMGGALLELVGILKLLDKTKGFKSLLSSTSILIIVQSLGDLADALKKFGKMSWNEIKLGLSAMGGALTELGIVIGLLGKFSGFSSIFGSISILIAVQGLSDLADALMMFGFMSWNEIKRGLTAMGSALTEVAIMSGTLGKLTGISGILGSGSILLAVQSLGDLADAFEQFGYMHWKQIKIGLVGMGGALTELATVTGTLGKLTGLSGLLGGGSLLVAVQGLGTLADALKKFGSITWDQVKIGLVAMGGALTEVGVISGALGYLTNFAGLLGSGSLLLAIQGLGGLADALKKFGDMDWDEIDKGLSAMGTALGETALGGFLSTFSIIGAYSISEIAEPLGKLADSVKKWKDVTVPEGLWWQLTKLASGISSFTLSGFGASAISTVAPGLGTLADSVKKWKDVKLPEGLWWQLTKLASGISSFTLSGFGASALNTAAPGIGVLADSVKKWKDVTVPEGLGDTLSDLASGVKSFSLAFLGGWSIDTVIGPLGDLAGTIKKWKDVTIPEGLGNGLSNLASGVKAFSLAFVGGWTLDSIIKPLGDLAGAIKKWNGISVPEGLKDGLKQIADGVKEFSLAFVGGWTLGSITKPLGDLAGAIKKFNGVKIPDDLSSDLISIANAVKSFSGISDFSLTAASITKIADAILKMTGIDFGIISNGLKVLGSGLKSFDANVKTMSGIGDILTKNIIIPLKNISSKLTKAGIDITSSLSKGVKSGSSKVSSTMTSLISKTAKVANSKTSEFYSVGSKLSNNFNDGLKKNASKAKESMTSGLKSAISVVRGYYSNFYSAGKYVASGLANGIKANQSSVVSAAKTMARKAYNAAKKELDINSPSKIFRSLGYSIPEGLAVGIEKLSYMASDASVNMANSAFKNTKQAIAKMAGIINGDIETQPTIRPVVDLSDVCSSVSTMNDMFGINPSVRTLATVGGINQSMDQLNQNGFADDVVSAIDKLRKDLGNIGGTTNVINGITYDDGSNINDAVATLVRAAKIGRRS